MLPPRHRGIKNIKFIHDEQKTSISKNQMKYKGSLVSSMCDPGRVKCELLHGHFVRDDGEETEYSLCEERFRCACQHTRIPLKGQ